MTADNANYFGQVALIDLVMINTRLREQEDRFRPWERTAGRVVWDKWQHGFKHLADAPYEDPFA